MKHLRRGLRKSSYPASGLLPHLQHKGGHSTPAPRSCMKPIIQEMLRAGKDIEINHTEFAVSMQVVMMMPGSETKDKEISISLCNELEIAFSLNLAACTQDWESLNKDRKSPSPDMN